MKERNLKRGALAPSTGEDANILKMLQDVAVKNTVMSATREFVDRGIKQLLSFRQMHECSSDCARVRKASELN